MLTSQVFLDQFIYIHGDLRLLKLDTNWDQTWGFDFSQYAKIFRYARQYGIRLVGLNAPVSLLNLINKVRVRDKLWWVGVKEGVVCLGANRKICCFGPFGHVGVPCCACL